MITKICYLVKFKADEMDQNQRIFEPKFIEGARNPGGFDQKKYLANYNCYVSIDIESTLPR